MASSLSEAYSSKDSFSLGIRKGFAASRVVTRGSWTRVRVGSRELRRSHCLTLAVVIRCKGGMSPGFFLAPNRSLSSKALATTGDFTVVSSVFFPVSAVLSLSLRPTLGVFMCKLGAFKERRELAVDLESLLHIINLTPWK